MKQHPEYLFNAFVLSTIMFHTLSEWILPYRVYILPLINSNNKLQYHSLPVTSMSPPPERPPSITRSLRHQPFLPLTAADYYPRRRGSVLVWAERA
ncbi:hypothetical protein Pcinc_007686 [Petrolisthes cinctipes]|uniref:Uncharacterized protein n=1 Tax=Petrolisthes cinctipes TaxID=88211 RepID=A0AAE1GAK8_PETCI|nr:hypothetical protein Pcinc_007686 [Petrolisthes cinctipes]